MKAPPGTRSSHGLIHPPLACARQGVALVLVLAFVVLLSGLVLAFFSRAISDRQISNGSANQTKADLFAQGAVATVVGDLKQEMLAGSTPFAFASPTPSGVTLYTLNTASAAVPYRVGTTTTLPNLVKRSAYNYTSSAPYPFYANTASASPAPSPYNTSSYPASARAIGVPSTTPSANGRSVSTARWNAHYLLPKKTLTSDTDATPITDFTPPDWVLVNRLGTNPTSWSSTLADPSPSNNSFVVGRYAYAVYNEGGLLDMNVAGYPSNTTPAQLAYKPAVAFADLTQIGLSQLQVDQIIGWRNYASTSQTGTIPNPSPTPFSLAQANLYNTFVLGNWGAVGFLTTANQALSSNQSDRMFSGRQSLIRFLVQGLGGTLTDPTSVTTRANLQNALQYMGTFSRDLEQPSFVPNPARPKVQGGYPYDTTQTNPPYISSSNMATFGTGNDAAGVDRATDPSTDINPPLLSVRVTAPFTRRDGTTSVVGEPLLKKRFALSRLSEIDLTKTATQDQSNPIYRDFGLFRTSTSLPWRYNHGSSTGILRLSAISGRDPDFFELLKAAINVGSLGKTALQHEPEPSSTPSYAVIGSIGYTQSVRDIKTALQILQIGADIIDQSDTDGYPTRIVLDGDSDPADEVRGMEDLPYLYEVRERPCFPTQAAGRYLMQPIIWNPHDSAGIHPTNAPSQFRIRAEPHNKSSGLLHSTGALLTYYGTGNTAPAPTCDWDLTTPVGTPLTFSAGEASGHYGFRDPTLLARTQIPAGTSVTGNETVESFNTGQASLVGLLAMDQIPLYIPNSAYNPASPGSAPQYYFLSKMNWDYSPPATASMGWIDFFMEYYDGSQWVPHSTLTEYIDSNGRTIFHTNVTTLATELSALNSIWKDTSPTAAIDHGDANAGRAKVDPRIQRFLPANSLFMNDVAMIYFPYNTYETLRGNSSWGHAGNNIGGWDDSGFTGFANYSKDGRGWQYNYWEENSIRQTYQDSSQDAGDSDIRYNRDPDGIVRRAMGGYVTDPMDYPATTNPLTQYVGLPHQNTAISTGSRPLILNRPFTSVAELGYASRGDNWKNISFSFPESGDSALLDVFCVDEVMTSNAMVAGKIDLNTAQAPVLQALLMGANTETTNASSVLSSQNAIDLSQALVARTSNTDPTVHKAPLSCRSDLVGAWLWNGTVASLVTTMKTNPNPDTYYSGFSSDIGTVASLLGKPEALITRKREAAIRALTDVGTARVWNLLIDVVAQSGHYGPNATSAAQFVTEGEKRYWLHVSIDRTNGNILDQKLEAVSE